MPNRILPPKTTCAILRRRYLRHAEGKEFYQKEVAADLQMSEVRWKQLELGQAPLSEKNALRLQDLYGISARWLLEGRLNARAVTPDGMPYSPAIARHARARHQSRSTGQEEQALAGGLFALLHEMRALVQRTRHLDQSTHEQPLNEAVAVYEEMRDALRPVLERHGITPLALAEAARHAPRWVEISHERILEGLAE